MFARSAEYYKKDGMSRPVIDDAVRELVFSCIPAVPYMEALRMFHTQPHQLWSADEISQRLYISASQSEKLLGDFSQAGFLAISDHKALMYSYSPASTALQQIVEKLVLTHATNLSGITNLIHERMRKTNASDEDIIEGTESIKRRRRKS